MYRLISLPICTLFLSLLIISCESFETRVPATEIKKASSWSKKDQFPSFPSCEGLKGEEVQKCFGSILGESVSSYLASQDLISSRAIDAEVILVIEVDKEGSISLASIEDPNYVLSDVTDLEGTLKAAIEQAPKALPATKTNVGSYVNVSIKLPVQIMAQSADE